MLRARRSENVNFWSKGAFLFYRFLIFKNCWGRCFSFAPILYLLDLSCTIVPPFKGELSCIKVRLGFWQFVCCYPYKYLQTIEQCWWPSICASIGVSVSVVGNLYTGKKQIGLWQWFMSVYCITRYIMYKDTKHSIHDSLVLPLWPM